MTPNAILLIKLLSDMAITVIDTVGKVSKMSDEEVDANIGLAEELSASLAKRRKLH